MKPAGVRLCARMEALLRELRGDLYDDVSDADVAACLRMFAALDTKLNRKTGSIPAPASARTRSRAA